MAQIPMAQGLGNQQRQVRQGVSVAGGQTAGLDAIGRLAQIGADVTIKLDQNRRAMKVATAATEASREIDTYVSTMLTDDRDYETQFKRYNEFVADTTKRYETEFKDDPSGFGAWKNKFSQFAFKKGFDVKANEVKGRIDLERGRLKTNMANLSELYLNGDDEQRQLITAESEILLQQAYEMGVVTAEERASESLDFTKSINTGVVKKEIQEDPDKAIAKLLNNEYQGLPSEMQAQLLEKANSEAEAKERKTQTELARLEREQEKAEKKIREEMSKAGDKLLSNGELNEQWLEENKDDLTDSDYRYFYKQLKDGDQGITDKETYSELRIRASNGDDVRDEARRALHKGMLKIADYEKLMNRSENNVGVSNLPNFYKRGEQYISRSLRVSDVNPDPASSQRLANALDDWEAWTRDNPNPTDEQARQAHIQIVDEYQIIQTNDLALVKRTPRFAVGSRQNLNTEETMLKTTIAYKKGELTDKEFAEQAELIMEWEEINKRRTGVK